MQTTSATFPFGKNWEHFVRHHLNPERIQAAQKHLAEFLEVSDLRGRSFLDVGCGSGLSSLAAYHLGAVKIVSFDIDADSVNTTTTLWEHAGKPEYWSILHGSVLDSQFLATLEPADIVYSWERSIIPAICGGLSNMLRH